MTVNVGNGHGGDRALEDVALVEEDLVELEVVVLAELVTFFDVVLVFVGLELELVDFVELEFEVELAVLVEVVVLDVGPCVVEALVFDETVLSVVVSVDLVVVAEDLTEEVEV